MLRYSRCQLIAGQPQNQWIGVYFIKNFTHIGILFSFCYDILNAIRTTVYLKLATCGENNRLRIKSWRLFPNTYYIYSMPIYFQNIPNFQLSLSTVEEGCCQEIFS